MADEQEPVVVVQADERRPNHRVPLEVEAPPGELGDQIVGLARRASLRPRRS